MKAPPIPNPKTDIKGPTKTAVLSNGSTDDLSGSMFMWGRNPPNIGSEQPPDDIGSF